MLRNVVGLPTHQRGQALGEPLGLVMSSLPFGPTLS